MYGRLVARESMWDAVGDLAQAAHMRPSRGEVMGHDARRSSASVASPSILDFLQRDFQTANYLSGAYGGQIAGRPNKSLDTLGGVIGQDLQKASEFTGPRPEPIGRLTQRSASLPGYEAGKSAYIEPNNTGYRMPQAQINREEIFIPDLPDQPMRPDVGISDYRARDPHNLNLDRDLARLL